MITFLVNLLGAPVRVIADALDLVLRGLRVLWGALTFLGRGIRTAWTYLVRGVSAFVGVLERLATDVYRGLKWLLVVQLPRWARWAIAQAAKGAGAVIAFVRTLITDAYHAALAFASRIVNTLAAWAHDAVSFLTSTLADAWNLVRKIAPLVLDMLVHPDRLAAFVFSQIWRLFWKTVQATIEPVARFIFANLIKVALSSFDFIESVLADVIGD